MCLQENDGMGFCVGLVGPPESQSLASSIPNPKQCITVSPPDYEADLKEHPHHVAYISLRTDFSVVPSVVTTIIFTPAPTATVTATIPVNEYLVEEISTVSLTTQMVSGILTRTVAPTSAFKSITR